MSLRGSKGRWARCPGIGTSPTSRRSVIGGRGRAASGQWVGMRCSARELLLLSVVFWLTTALPSRSVPGMARMQAGDCAAPPWSRSEGGLQSLPPERATFKAKLRTFQSLPCPRSKAARPSCPEWSVLVLPVHIPPKWGMNPFCQEGHIITGKGQKRPQNGG